METEKLLDVPRLTGKIINIETLFPEWSSDEIWSEPLAPEKVPKITFPSTLYVESQTTISQFYNLAAEEVDPKAKAKKDKKPAKGGPVDTELTEQLVNEDGKPLPVVYRDDEGFASMPPLKRFLSRRRHNATEADIDGDDLVDPMICDAFRLIHEFGTRIVREHPPSADRPAVQDLDSNYLWRAIYPKLPSGKPCYNPSGKYAVKLFLAGKWRKVYVDDSIPLNAAGEVALATSADPLELWPLLLSKAIYTVYTACGYSFAGGATVDKSDLAAKATPAQQTCQFVSFAVHLLTAWHPHHSADAATLFLTEKSKSLKLINQMVAAGVPSVHRDNIVYDADSLTFHFADALPAGFNTDGLELEDIAMKTKRQFKEEYMSRRKVRDEITEAIKTREEKIEIVAQQVDCSKKEIFCIVLYNENKCRHEIFPVLGLCFPDDLPADAETMLETKLLLHWQRLPAVDTIPAVDDPIILGKGKVPVPEFMQPFPRASPLQATWKTLQELSDEGAFLTALFTNTHSNRRAEWSRHWISTAPAVDATADKGKDKKKAKDAPVVEVEEQFTSAGLPPVTFLSLNVSELFDNRLSQAELEVQAALDDQHKAMQKSASGDGSITFFDVDLAKAVVATPDGLVMTFTIHADMVAEDKPAVEAPVASPARPTRGMGKRQTSWDASSIQQQKVLPSDTVLLIQEVRFDTEEPLVFIMELKETSQFPIMSKSFTIPKHKLPTDGSQMLFWMRLFTKSSVYVCVNTAVEAVIGLAEDIWPMAKGYPTFVREGDTTVTVDDTDQLLFRLPLSVQQVQREEGVKINGKALAYLHVTDAHLEQHNHLLLVNHKNGQSTGHEDLLDLQGQLIDFYGKQGLGEILMGYCHPIAANHQVSKFHWKLVILSFLPLAEPSRPINEVAVSQRYTGRYFANNKFKLFRDVYSFDKTTFPLALKLTVVPLEEMDVPIVLKMYRKGDDKVIAEYSSDNVILVYFQDISKFLEDAPDAAAVAAAAAPAKGAKDKKNATPTVDSVDLVFECTLSTEHVENLPEACFSRFPHAFDDLFEKGNEEDTRPGAQVNKNTVDQQKELLAIKPPTQALLRWTLDILSGTVVQVQHDISTLVKFAGMKNAWEDKSSGETERATAAITYVKEKLKVCDVNKLAAESTGDFVRPLIELTPVMAEHLVTALEGELDDLQPRFGRLHKLPKVNPTEHL